MVRLIGFASLSLLAACGGTERDQAGQDTSPLERGSAQIQFSTSDLMRICKAGIAFRNGRSTNGIDAKINAKQQVRLNYSRNSDKKTFSYDCLVEGNILRFRMIDQAGPGTWSGEGSKTTFKLKPDSVEIRDEFFDGSSDTKTIEI